MLVRVSSTNVKASSSEIEGIVDVVVNLSFIDSLFTQVP